MTCLNNLLVIFGRILLLLFIYGWNFNCIFFRFENLWCEARSIVCKTSLFSEGFWLLVFKFNNNPIPLAITQVLRYNWYRYVKNDNKYRKYDNEHTKTKSTTLYRVRVNKRLKTMWTVIDINKTILITIFFYCFYTYC